MASSGRFSERRKNLPGIGFGHSDYSETDASGESVETGKTDDPVKSAESGESIESGESVESNDSDDSVETAASITLDKPKGKSGPQSLQFISDPLVLDALKFSGL